MRIGGLFKSGDRARVYRLTGFDISFRLEGDRVRIRVQEVFLSLQDRMAFSIKTPIEVEYPKDLVNKAGVLDEIKRIVISVLETVNARQLHPGVLEAPAVSTESYPDPPSPLEE
jgi:hypothetical protein